MNFHTRNRMNPTPLLFLGLVMSLTLAACGGTTTATSAQHTSVPTTQPSTPCGLPACPPPTGNPPGGGTLCSNPCTDGQGDYVDQVAIMPGRFSQILELRVRLTNKSSTSASIDPYHDLAVVDSRQMTLDPNFYQSTDQSNASFAQCTSDINAITLVPGATITFHPCYNLADSQDTPQRFLVGGIGGNEIVLH